MNGTSVIVDLPASAYHQLEQQAKNTRRSIAAEARDILLRNLNEQSCDPEKIFPEIAALRTMSDEELQAMVQRRLPEQMTAQSEELIYKQQRDGLTEEEKATLAELLTEFDKHMLMRSQAFLLLKQRGHDIDQYLNRP